MRQTNSTYTAWSTICEHVISKVDHVTAFRSTAFFYKLHMPLTYAIASLQFRSFGSYPSPTCYSAGHCFRLSDIGSSLSILDVFIFVSLGETTPILERLHKSRFRSRTAHWEAAVRLEKYRHQFQVVPGKTYES